MTDPSAADRPAFPPPPPPPGPPPSTASPSGAAPAVPPPSNPPASNPPASNPPASNPAPTQAPAQATPPSAGSADEAGNRAGLLSWLALVAIVLSVFLEEHGSSNWEHRELWSAFAIATTAATVVPSIKSSFKLDDAGAWRVAAGGVAGLAAYWLLLVLPSIGQNTSFAATVALVLAAAATWTAPGRPDLDES